jgi:hypothetical protein
LRWRWFYLADCVAYYLYVLGKRSENPLSPELIVAEAVFANECTLGKTDSDGASSQLEVYSQESANLALENCTGLIGSLYISSNYTGSLNLSGITNITGDIFATDSGLTEFYMDDLLYLSQFTSTWAQNLTSISFARLLNISKIWVVTTLLPVEFSVPSLVDAGSIELDGNLFEVYVLYTRLSHQY